MTRSFSLFVKTFTLIIACVFTILVLSNCKKKESPETGYSKISVRMTDAPGPYSEVNIDLKGVEITGHGGSAVMLNVNPGIYNLLNFTNGLDTLIATGSINAGRVQQIRLILGNNNSLKIGNTTYPLATPSAQQSGLKLQLHETFESGVAYSLLLDFDANKSIVEEGNGSYSLKPVIRVIQNAISGSIKGKINPAVNAVVTANGNGSAYSSGVNSNGDFIVQGLPAGSYTVTIVPAAPNNSVSINSVNVTVGNTTNIGTINL